MAITVPPVRGAGDLGHVDDSNIVRQALLDLDTADTGHMPVKGDVHGFRWDETVGRRLFAWDAVNGREQMIFGDTGWRNVSSLLENGWGGSLFLRRVMSQVYLSGRITVPAAGFTAVYLTMPAGFKSDPSSVSGYNMGTAFNASASRTLLPMFMSGTASASLAGTGSPSNLIDIGGGFTTPDSWPASLPGSATGVIPTGLVMDTAELLPAEEY